MAKRMDYLRNEKGASARHLVLMFLAAIAVCAVFFSLGFVVGYNHAPSQSTLAMENVTPSGNIPPTVNSPAGGTSAGAGGLETENVSRGSSSVPPAEHAAPSPPKPAATARKQAPKPQKKATSRKVAKSKPAAAPRRRPAAAASAPSSSQFAVQVMASRTHTDAANLVKLLRSHGYRAYVLTPQQAHSKDKLFRVQVGPFPTRVAADSARDKLRGEGFRPFVVH
jgi:cell division septation protein DedD